LLQGNIGDCIFDQQLALPLALHTPVTRTKTPNVGCNTLPCESPMLAMIEATSVKIAWGETVKNIQF
jgi:hypothetical protein